jgi:hypothetical protein
MLDEFDYICLYHTTMVCHNNMETFTCDAKGGYNLVQAGSRTSGSFALELFSASKLVAWVHRYV